MRELHDKAIAIDYLTLKDELERRGELSLVGGLSFLVSLEESSPSVVHIETWCDRLRQKTRAREAVSIGDELIKRHGGAPLTIRHRSRPLWRRRWRSGSPH